MMAAETNPEWATGAGQPLATDNQPHLGVTQTPQREPRSKCPEQQGLRGGLEERWLRGQDPVLASCTEGVSFHLYPRGCPCPHGQRQAECAEQWECVPRAAVTWAATLTVR